jgi:hypothetical protein
MTLEDRGRDAADDHDMKRRGQDHQGSIFVVAPESVNAGAQGQAVVESTAS